MEMRSLKSVLDYGDKLFNFLEERTKVYVSYDKIIKLEFDTVRIGLCSSS